MIHGPNYIMVYLNPSLIRFSYIKGDQISKRNCMNVFTVSY